MTDAGAPPGPAEDVVGLVRDGQAKFASGELEAARTAFARALELQPEDAGAKAGLERCDRLLAERDDKEAEATPEPDDKDGEPPPAAWTAGRPRSEDFPDSAENPEATVVDPNYLLGVRGDAGASGEFPEPLTAPRGAIDKGSADTDPAGDAPPRPPAAGEPSYPRFVSTMPGNYPEVRPGGRPVVPSPPPAPGTAQPGPSAVVTYPQMPPGGPSPYPQFATPVGGYPPAPMAAPPIGYGPPRHFMTITAAVGIVCLLLGLLLGWAIFGAADEETAPAAGDVVPLVTGDAGAGDRPAGKPTAPP